MRAVAVREEREIEIAESTPGQSYARHTGALRSTYDYICSRGHDVRVEISGPDEQPTHGPYPAGVTSTGEIVFTHGIKAVDDGDGELE